MPESTIQFPFEHKIFMWLDAKSAMERPGDPQTFVLRLYEDGSPGELLFDKPEGGWHSYRDRLKEEGRPFVFFDPFDYPEYGWFEWHGVDRAAMEGLLGEPFAADDFVSPKNGERIAYPSDWGVMH
ncbi:MAG: hypothetical protein PVF27_03115 [Gemmatimonadales bacterium]|jgi:hypothetical protein